MDMDRIRQIIDWFADAGLASFELAEGDDRIRLERPEGSGPVAVAPGAGPIASPVVPAAPVVPADPSETRIDAPLYGVCYLAPSPDAPAFITVGQAVKAGDTLCLVEAMKVLNAITAPRDGTVTEIAAPDGVEVEQGQHLVTLR